MFSGIIENIRKPKKVTKEKGGIRIQIPCPQNWELKAGDSVSLDGVCTTVEKIENKMFTVFLMPETLSKTNLSQIATSHTLNLEIPLSLNSLVGGHLVSGHIDTTGKIENIVEEKDSKVITVKIPSNFTKYIVYKGSIAVNGVSLTIVSVTENSFVVSLIPYTLTHTNLGELKKGDIVNIEVDLIAKYLEKLV